MTDYSGLEASINRNIVECKGLYRKKPISAQLSINRNIVECKDGTGETKRTKHTVLIET